MKKKPTKAKKRVTVVLIDKILSLSSLGVLAQAK
jgi:hypothetical protein